MTLMSKIYTRVEDRVVDAYLGLRLTSTLFILFVGPLREDVLSKTHTSRYLFTLMKSLKENENLGR